MSIPSMEDMLKAGVHFGHQTLRWNPKMRPYLLGEKNGIHIINLSKTQEGLKKAFEGIDQCLRAKKKILFVGTKKSVRHCLSEEAIRSKSFYVTDRWLGGMLTNFATVKKSIDKLLDIEKKATDGILANLKKKEQITIEKKRVKLDAVLGGIRDMHRQPGLLFIVDIKHEHIAVREAARLGIPTIAIVDSNTDPEEVTFPIPGNDDAIKSVSMITKTITDYIVERGANLGEGSETIEEAQASAKAKADAEIEEAKEGK